MNMSYPFPKILGLFKFLEINELTILLLHSQVQSALECINEIASTEKVDFTRLFFCNQISLRNYFLFHIDLFEKLIYWYFCNFLIRTLRLTIV